MSIYCTLWELRFPLDGVSFPSGRTEIAFSSRTIDDIEVFAQAVPAHIQDDGPKWAFLTSPVHENSPHHRTVIITTEADEKGTKRNGQEYRNPLLTYDGAYYARIAFDDLYSDIMEQLRIRHKKSMRAAKRAARRELQKHI